MKDEACRMTPQEWQENAGIEVPPGHSKLVRGSQLARRDNFWIGM